MLYVRAIILCHSDDGTSNNCQEAWGHYMVLTSRVIPMYEAVKLKCVWEKNTATKRAGRVYMCVCMQAVGDGTITNKDKKTDPILNCIHLSSIYLHRCHLFWKHGNCHVGANPANLDDGDHVCQEVATRYLQSSVQNMCSHRKYTLCILNITSSQQLMLTKLSGTKNAHTNIHKNTGIYIQWSGYTSRYAYTIECNPIQQLCHKVYFYNKI